MIYDRRVQRVASSRSVLADVALLSREGEEGSQYECGSSHAAVQSPQRSWHK